MIKRTTSALPRASRRATHRTRAADDNAIAASAEAYTKVHHLIVTGRLAPGAPLIETDLSVRLGVSRTPIRAALQRLQQEGFVIGSRVGHMVRSIVSPLTAHDMWELFLMVGALEGVAARLAAQLEANARSRLVVQLERLNGDLRAVTTARTPEIGSTQELHERFHRSVVDAAAGPRLRAELAALQPQAERYGRAYTGAAIREFEASLSEHEAIIEAIRAADADAAERATTANWRNGAERYRRIVELHGERGNW